MIPTREEWISNPPLVIDDEENIWYTDGSVSLTNERAGAGVVCTLPQFTASFPFGT